jgi:hypothetical protein
MISVNKFSTGDGGHHHEHGPDCHFARRGFEDQHRHGSSDHRIADNISDSLGIHIYMSRKGFSATRGHRPRDLIVRLLLLTRRDRPAFPSRLA